MHPGQRQSLECAVLGFLMREPMHGYDLYQRVEAEVGRVWYVGMSNLYGVLKRLEEAGQIESTLTPQESRPPRKVYCVTPAGQELFLDWVRHPVPSMRDLRVEFLTKLYFHRILELPEVEQLIAAQETLCRERLGMLERNAARCGPRDFDRMVFDFRRRQIQAILDWLTAYREEIDPQTSNPGGSE